MPIEIDGVILRNIQEQVKKNQDDIKNIKMSLGDSLPDPIPGPQGPQGAKGPQGPQGAKGPGIYGTYVELPSTASFKEGDLLLLANGNLFKKENNLWKYQASLKGPQGDSLPGSGPSEYIEKLQETLAIEETETGNNAEFGKNVKIDGKLILNDANDITDQEGNMLCSVSGTISDGSWDTLTINGKTANVGGGGSSAGLRLYKHTVEFADSMGLPSAEQFTFLSNWGSSITSVNEFYTLFFSYGAYHLFIEPKSMYGGAYLNFYGEILPYEDPETMEFINALELNYVQISGTTIQLRTYRGLTAVVYSTVVEL